MADPRSIRGRSTMPSVSGVADTLAYWLYPRRLRLPTRGAEVPVRGHANVPRRRSRSAGGNPARDGPARPLVAKNKGVQMETLALMIGTGLINWLADRVGWFGAPNGVRWVVTAASIIWIAYLGFRLV